MLLCAHCAGADCSHSTEHHLTRPGVLPGPPRHPSPAAPSHWSSRHNTRCHWSGGSSRVNTRPGRAAPRSADPLTAVRLGGVRCGAGEELIMETRMDGTMAPWQGGGCRALHLPLHRDLPSQGCFSAGSAASAAGSYPGRATVLLPVTGLMSALPGCRGDTARVLHECWT